jgi:hypothetical protein
LNTFFAGNTPDAIAAQALISMENAARDIVEVENPEYSNHYKHPVQVTNINNILGTNVNYIVHSVEPSKFGDAVLKRTYDAKWFSQLDNSNKTSLGRGNWSHILRTPAGARVNAATKGIKDRLKVLGGLDNKIPNKRMSMDVYVPTSVGGQPALGGEGKMVDNIHDDFKIMMCTSRMLAYQPMSFAVKLTKHSYRFYRCVLVRGATYDGNRMKVEVKELQYRINLESLADYIETTKEALREFVAICNHLLDIQESTELSLSQLSVRFPGGNFDNIGCNLTQGGPEDKDLGDKGEPFNQDSGAKFVYRPQSFP